MATKELVEITVLHILHDHANWILSTHPEKSNNVLVLQARHHTDFFKEIGLNVLCYVRLQRLHSHDDLCLALVIVSQRRVEVFDVCLSDVNFTKLSIADLFFENQVVFGELLHGVASL